MDDSAAGEPQAVVGLGTRGGKEGPGGAQQ